MIEREKTRKEMHITHAGSEMNKPVRNENYMHFNSAERKDTCVWKGKAKSERKSTHTYETKKTCIKLMDAHAKNEDRADGNPAYGCWHYAGDYMPVPGKSPTGLCPA